MENRDLKIKILEDGIPALVLPPDILLVEKNADEITKLIEYRKRFRKPIKTSELFDELDYEDEY